jgi:outer membrane lipoprotein-sorting protein
MKNTLRAAFLTAIIAALPANASAQNGFTLDQVFAKLDEVSKTFHSIETGLEETKVTVIVNDRDVKSGKMYYSRGKEPRLKLEITKPQSEFVLVANGKLQIYTPKIKQVQEASIAGKQNLVEMLLALGFGQTSQDLKKNYEITLAPDETVDGQKTTVLDLKPKNSGTFQSVRLWLDQKEWHAVQLKTTEKSGDYEIFKYSNSKVNGSIPDSRFKLDLPKDVKIIKL